LPPLDTEQEVVIDNLPTDPGQRPTNALSNTCPRLTWLIPAVLCLVIFGQLFFSGLQLSQTSDEATHLYAGYRYLKCGALDFSREHPPLARVVAAAPLLSMNLNVDCAPFKGDDVQQAFAGVSWLYSQNWPVALARARMAVSVFAVGLVLLVWTTARRMFGLTTAIVAGLLLVFEPNVLAYGSLVMTDVPVTCMLLFAVLGFYLWATHRTLQFLLLTALAAGLTLLAKHSGVVVVPILVALAVADACIQPDGRGDGDRRKWPAVFRHLLFRNLLAVGLICVLAVCIVWVGYGMRFAPYPGASQLQGQRQPATSARERVLQRVEDHHLLPRTYLQGFASALTLPNQGSVVFVDGKVYSHAPWFSTPLNFMIRSSAAMLAMMVVAAFGIAIAPQQQLRERLFLLIPAAVYLGVCIHASTDVSVRYLLPMFPFLLIAVATGCVELAQRVRWAGYALPCLIVLHAVSSLHAYPNYLSYANELWGGPTQAYKYLPGVDWGQAYPQAKHYLERHPAESCWLITGWQWDPAFYGLPCQTFGLYLPHEIPSRVHGIVIVSSTLITDVRPAEGELAAAFKNVTPKDHIGGSALLVYDGDFDTRLDAATGERNLATYAFSMGQLSSALEHGKKAVDMAPESALAHATLCRLLAPTQMNSALKECYIARNLLRNDPLRQEQIRTRYLDSLETLSYGAAQQ
jgi:dolichyl-phosphate-mannose-protein mannosyltransferase